MYNDCNVSKLRESHKAMSTKRVFDMWPRTKLGYGKNLLDTIDNPQRHKIAQRLNGNGREPWFSSQDIVCLQGKPEDTVYGD